MLSVWEARTVLAFLPRRLFLSIVPMPGRTPSSLEKRDSRVERRAHLHHSAEVPPSPAKGGTLLFVERLRPESPGVATGQGDCHERLEYAPTSGAAGGRERT